jgi:hypothetical protein
MRGYTYRMGRSVIITTPIPTADEVAKRLRMGKKRVAMIREIVRQIRETPQKAAPGHTRARGSANSEKAAS